MKNPDSKSESKKWDIIISQDQEGIRLDKTLALYPDFASRSRVASLFSSGRVMLEDKCLKPSFIPKAGDCISIFIPQEKPPNMIEAFEFSLEILFEDSHLIVLNKPSGLVVHPSQGHQRDTLVNALVHHTKDLAMGFHEQRPGIVHRLDKDTSGILVVAKNDRAHSFLAKQFKEKTVHRVYQALVYGTPLPTYSTIRSHLHRHPIDRKKFASTQRNPEKDPPQGKLAITHYRTLASSPQKFSLLECR
ncbi:MAG: RluA family pseudouridine synthase, partial [Bdellovibrionales bacterium]|nr:RluA family pseudouridine synthase [Bdellovibrionales bacterium]